MRISTFEQNILNPMKTCAPDLDSMRPWSAYQDIVNIFDLITSYSQSPGGQNLSHAPSNVELNNERLVSSMICTLHKALIEFANIFTTILIHEAQQRPKDALTIGKLVEESIATSINRDVLQQAYCLYIYRNKVVIHHDIPRNNAYLREGDGTRRLMPIGAGRGPMNQNDLKSLFDIQKKYMTYPEIASETNPYELLNKLFYRVPAPQGSKSIRGSDRDIINKLVEKGGCRSMSPLEIIKTVDDFSFEIAQLTPF